MRAKLLEAKTGKIELWNTRNFTSSQEDIDVAYDKSSDNSPLNLPVHFPSHEQIHRAKKAFWVLL
mgnify:CR=1 FL=1